MNRQAPTAAPQLSPTSRRAVALAALAGIALTVPGANASRAQGDVATPVASPESDNIGLLFVQSFASSTVGPADAEGLVTFTLRNGTGQTMYFSERPNRLVGTIETGTFIDAFRDATADDPANAAVVAQNGLSDEVAYVVELLGMRHDAGSGDVTYTVRMLADPADVDMELPEMPLLTIEGAGEHDTTQVFIDAGGMMQLVAYGAQDV